MRRQGDFDGEKCLNSRIRCSARRDRRTWLEQSIADGSWASIGRLRKPRPTKHVHIRRLDGSTADMGERPEVMADYFEKVQWKTQFAELQPSGSQSLGPSLPVETGNFTLEELKFALRKLKCGKAAGVDGVPPDFWKLLLHDDDACNELLNLCQRCWSEKDIPTSWRKACVVLLFKKGEPALPSNYRPISLLCVGYKVLASMIHKRLLEGGSEERMRPSQYGFRPKRGTGACLQLVRRMIDAAHQSNTGGMILLLLDWAKAFDRMKPDAMCSALLRFGLPPAVVEMVSGIYSSRFFNIRDHAGESSVRRQNAGIAQGCPLSPYIFIIVQSVMLHDVFSSLDLLAEPDYIVTRDVLYADDTLLVSRHVSNLQAILGAIVDEGRRYGLELNMDKTLQIQVSTAHAVCGPNGELIKSVRQAIYLGGCISCDGRAGAEITRRIGEGHKMFESLRMLWEHGAVTARRKIRIYTSCVVSKLLYSLESLWLLQVDRARINAFHCMCLRRIQRIPHSYISRISNAEVLARANSKPLSDLLQHRQVQAYTNIVNDESNSYIKKLVCENDESPKIWVTRRRRGRPRQRWAECVHKLAQNS